MRRTITQGWAGKGAAQTAADGRREMKGESKYGRGGGSNKGKEARRTNTQGWTGKGAAQTATEPTTKAVMKPPALMMAAIMPVATEELPGRGL